MLNPLEQYEVAIKEIFTYERLPAILAVLNSFRPPYGGFVKSNEFATVVYAAQVDAIDEQQRKLTQFVMNNNALPTPK
jgi:hypothetical protein